MKRKIRMNSEKITIGFIGAGAIGSLFGGYLAAIKKTNYLPEVIFFCREKHAQEISENGLKVHNENGKLIIKNIKAYKNLRDFELNRGTNLKYGFDYVFLTTKTYDIKEALTQYKKVIDSSKWIVILQNGIGNEDLIQKFCDKYRIIRIITSHGAILKFPGHVFHTGKGFTKIGFSFLNSHNFEDNKYKAAQSDLFLLRDLLITAGILTTVVESITDKAWEKVIINVGINALGALTRLNNGKLLESDGLKNIMAEVVKEALVVAKLKKIRLSKINYIELTYSVAEKTYMNRNSMLQDILKGKKTEIDFINGRIVKYAEELGVNAPVNKLLTNLIKGLEESLN